MTHQYHIYLVIISLIGLIFWTTFTKRRINKLARRKQIDLMMLSAIGRLSLSLLFTLLFIVYIVPILGTIVLFILTAFLIIGVFGLFTLPFSTVLGFLFIKNLFD